jgi:hypothetical protein
MPKTIIYVNVPLYADEYEAIQTLARQEGRAKGQQLRILAVQALSGGTVTPEPMDESAELPANDA